MIRYSANLSVLFPEVPLLDRFERAAQAGFSHVEFWFPYAYDIAGLKARLEDYDLRLVLFNSYPGEVEQGESGLAADPDRRDDYRRTLDEALEIAQELRCPNLHVMLGRLRPDLSYEAHLHSVLENLAWSAPRARQAGVTLLIEALNPFDNPDYFVSSSQQGLAIVRQVDQPNVKFQFDFYHLQIVEGNVTTTFRQNLPDIGHVQIADVPGRHQPGTGELNYPYILRAIDESGYQGFVGLEYKPEGGTEESLQWLPRAERAVKERLPGLLPLNKDELFANLPPVREDKELSEQIRRLVDESGRKVVVLIDYAGGTQTMHDVDVLTRWTEADLSAALAGPERAFYILTNSRNLPGSLAGPLNVEIATNLARAAHQSGEDFVVVSCSDPTLRGHYPLEIDVLQATLEVEMGWSIDAHLIVPAFPEAGRFTIRDVQWVADGSRLLPASQTVYARDPTFGYHAANLRDWVAEMTQGLISADEVISISLESIRQGGPEEIERILLDLQNCAPVVVNAVTSADLDVLAAGILRAEATGKRFLYRTAAAFVKARSATPNRPLLSAADLQFSPVKQGGGLVVIGSHIQEAKDEFRSLQSLNKIQAVELQVASVLEPTERDIEVERVAALVDETLTGGQTAILITSRDLATGVTKETTLRTGNLVSAALADVAFAVHTPPRFIIVQGWATANDVATQGLGLRRARVLGEIAPGATVWRLGDESRFPGTPYIIFPVTDGGVISLAKVFRSLL